MMRTISKTAVATGGRARNRTSGRVGSVMRTMAAVGLALAPLGANGALPDSGLGDKATRLSDSELADMRGKFIDPGGVSYFGLALQTSWQGADGITTMATILFSVDFADGLTDLEGATPHLMVGWSRDCDGCSDPSMDVTQFGPAAESGYVAITPADGVVPVGGLATVQGAVQSSNIAGSDNHVSNGMSIAVVPASAVAGTTPQGLQEVTSGKSVGFADGDRIQFIVQSNELALALSGNGGKDAVLQSVNGDLNQAAQHVLLSSNLNNVSNFVGMTVGLNELRQSDRMRVDHALSVMKGRGF